MSALRAYSQIPASVKYLEAAVESVAYDVDTLSTYPAFSLGVPVSEIGAINSIVTDADVDYDKVTPVEFEDDYPRGTMFKDLGRQLLVVDANAKHVALFRQVQLVRGSDDTEGVGGTAPIWNCLYVKVWAADGNNVCVVRTGPGSPA